MSRNERLTASSLSLFRVLPTTVTAARMHRLPGNGECLTLGLHRGCSNIWNQVFSPRKRVKYAKRCENKHLPVVQVSSPLAAAAAAPSAAVASSAAAAAAKAPAVAPPAAAATDADSRINHLKCSDDVTGFIACSRIQQPSSVTSSVFPSTGYSGNRASAAAPSSPSAAAAVTSTGDDCDPLQTNDSPWKCIRTRPAAVEEE